MDVAGVIIGSVALLLSLFGAAVSAVQLTHYIRFRKPRLRAEYAKLPVKKGASGSTIGPGKVVINARGGARPMAITTRQIHFFLPSGQPLGGYGSGSIRTTARSTLGMAPLPSLVELPPEEWLRLEVDIDPFSLKQLPERLDMAVYLATAESRLPPLLVPFVLSKDDTKYQFDNLDELRRNSDWTWDHPGRATRDRLRRLSRRAWQRFRVYRKTR